MVEITKETLEMQYRKQRGYMTKTSVVTVILMAVSIILVHIAQALNTEGAVVNILKVLAIASFAGIFVYGHYVRKKVLPRDISAAVRQTFMQIRYDFTSDRVVDFIYSQIGRAKNYPDKTMLTLFLADVYLFRGQVNEAISMLGSVDRSRFLHYPNTGMSFYNDIISLYDAVGDTASVLAAYNDAEAFIDECAFRNYLTCRTALETMIMVEKARGNYRKALDMQLIKNEYENISENDARKVGAAQTDPMTAFNRGMIFLSTAELFYLCGDVANAGKYLDIGGPMLSPSPFFLQRANELSGKIRQGLMNKG